MNLRYSDFMSLYKVRFVKQRKFHYLVFIDSNSSSIDDAYGSVSKDVHGWHFYRFGVGKFRPRTGFGDTRCDALMDYFIRLGKTPPKAE